MEEQKYYTMGYKNNQYIKTKKYVKKCQKSLSNTIGSFIMLLIMLGN